MKSGYGNLVGFYYGGCFVFADNRKFRFKLILIRIRRHHQHLPSPIFALILPNKTITKIRSEVFRFLEHHIRYSHFTDAAYSIFAHAIKHGLIEHWNLYVATGVLS